MKLHRTARQTTMRGLAVAVVALSVAAGCGSDDDGFTTASTTTESSAPEPVFDYATDSLCDWLTADDMDEIVAAAQQRAGTAYELKAFESCEMMWDAEGASQGCP